MTLKENALRTAVLKALLDAVKAELDTGRATLLDDLCDLYESTGGKTLDVRLGEAKVATVSLSFSKPANVVVNDTAFVEYVGTNHPEAVYTVVLDAFKRTYLPSLIPTEAGCVDPDTGEVVPGVQHTEDSTPKTFSVRFADRGREEIAAAWVRGELYEIAPHYAPMLEA